MNVSKRISVYTLYAILIFLFGGDALGADDQSSDLLPAGLVIEEVFKPGPGSPVGKIEMVEGQVIIIHAGVLSGYLAEKDLPLFTGDTIVALESGRISFKLNDGSTLALASETKLVMNRTVFDLAKKSRVSFLSMSLGKARFLVKKIAGLKRSEFKVRTPTAVCGIRGSDFIASVTADSTEISVLSKTVLEVRRLAFPEKPPVIVKEEDYCPKCGFARVIVTGSGAWKVRASSEEIEETKKLFEIKRWFGRKKMR
jgi:hypothetical protein